MSTGGGGGHEGVFITGRRGEREGGVGAGVVNEFRVGAESREQR
jgi:hypothetical protein